VSYARMQGQRRRGVQTDVTRDWRLHFCNEFIVSHCMVHSQKTYD
jgi:hypothetical protein